MEDLLKLGLLRKVEKINHRIPICWRSKNPIEFISMKEFYLKQLPFIQELLSLIEKMEFYPEEAKKLLVDWINSISSHSSAARSTSRPMRPKPLIPTLIVMIDPVGYIPKHYEFRCYFRLIFSLALLKFLSIAHC